MNLTLIVVINLTDGFSNRYYVKKPYNTYLEFSKEKDRTFINNVCPKVYKIAYCVATKENANLVLIGDSIARSFFVGLTQLKNPISDGILLLGEGGCPPLLDIKSGYVEGSELCQGKLSDAILEVVNDKKIETVLLAADWSLYIESSRELNSDPYWSISNPNYPDEESDEIIFSKSLYRTLEELKSKRVYLLYKNPFLPFDLEQCIFDRPFSNKHLRSKCYLSRIDNNLNEKKSIQLIESISSKFDNVILINPSSILCSPTKCDWYIPEVGFMYVDSVHLSRSGSAYLFSKMQKFLR